MASLPVRSFFLTVVVILSLMTTLPAPCGAGPVCRRIISTELADISLCASSVLSTQKGNTYGPANTMDGDNATAWVEAAAGVGVGEWIEMAFGAPLTFQSIELGNGYAKSNKSYRDNGRIKKLRILAEGGYAHVVILRDTPRMQRVRLPEPVLSGWVRFEILSTYPGKRWKDTALNELMVDLEEHNRNTWASSFLTEMEAEERLNALPEVRQFFALTNAEGRKGMIMLEEEATPNCSQDSPDCRWCFSILSDMGGHVSRWETMCVHAWSGEVTVYDVIQDASVPYHSWSANYPLE